MHSFRADLQMPTSGGKRRPWGARALGPCGVGFALTMLASCAGLSRLPSEGGDPWWRLESDHFVVYTDDGRDDATRTLLRLERWFSGMQQAGWHTEAALPGKLSVVLFDSPSDYRAFASWELLGHAIPEAAMGNWAATYTTMQLNTVRHEITHQVAYGVLRYQPKWFAEGIASLYETADFDAAGHMRIGAVPMNRWRALARRGGPMPVRELFSDTADTLDGRFYGTAWLLTHYLLFNRGPEFAAYQRALARGVSFERAFRSHFPDLDPTTLDIELRHYYEDGRYARYSLPVDKRLPRLQVTALGDADVLALRALLFAHCARCDTAQGDARARRAAQRALALDPGHPLAAAVLHLDLAEVEGAQARGEQVAKAHPDSAVGWAILALALARQAADGGDLSVIQGYLDRALAAEPFARELQVLAAGIALKAGWLERARALSDRALSLWPADRSTLAAAVAVAVAGGRCLLARDALRRLGELPHGLPAAALAKAAALVAQHCPPGREAGAAAATTKRKATTLQGAPDIRSWEPL